MAAKLGLDAPHPELVDDLLELLHAQRVDFTLFFRALAAGTARALFAEPEPFDAWAARREALLPADRTAVAAAMNRVNPVYIPRNHRVEEALTAATGGRPRPVPPAGRRRVAPVRRASRPRRLRRTRPRGLRPARHLLRHLSVAPLDEIRVVPRLRLRRDGLVLEPATGRPAVRGGVAPDRAGDGAGRRERLGQVDPRRGRCRGLGGLAHRGAGPLLVARVRGRGRRPLPPPAASRRRPAPTRRLLPARRGDARRVR